ncbi:MAG: phosphate ABC transporter substrate-binding protein [Dehalococcoidales bacterium]|nr:phosphate ABC transporter substrate-binding protein [Dehalococcoidales bacterium]
MFYKNSMYSAMKKSQGKWSILTLLLLALLLVTAGCGGASKATPEPTATVTESVLSGSFKIIGSNTVTPLSSVWAENFMKMHPKVSIAVSGPGTGVGIASLIDGTTDICQASRLITAKEIEQAQAKGVNPYEIQIASDALSVIVHPSNPVSELTIEQLSAIYTGKITNWKEVGGNDAAIVVLSRDTNSGTHAFFKEHVVQMQGLPTADKGLEYGGKVLMLPSTEEGVSQVAGNANAIFYAGLGYVNDKVKTIAIKKTATDPAVKPSVATTLDGTYPIARPLLFYTNGAPTGVIKAFIDYCLSEEGQKVVLEAGFIPVGK